MQNIFAHTDAGHDYPAYISVNKDADGSHRISVRSAGNGGRNLGEIHVSPETLEHMATDVLAAISGEKPIAAGLRAQLEALSTSFEAKTAPEQWLLEQLAALVATAKVSGASEPGYCSDERPCVPCFTDNGTCDDKPATDHECCGKCQAEPAAQIGNEPLAPTLEQYKALTERMASDLQSMQNLLCVAVKKMGGTLAVSHADADGMDGMVLVGKPDTNNDFVLTLVEASTVLQ